MQINVQPNDQNTTQMTVIPDTGSYALVTLDGDNAGTFSILVVPDTGWEDDTVKQTVLGWFGLTEA